MAFMLRNFHQSQQGSIIASKKIMSDWTEQKIKAQTKKLLFASKKCFAALVASHKKLFQFVSIFETKKVFCSKADGRLTRAIIEKLFRKFNFDFFEKWKWDRETSQPCRRQNIWQLLLKPRFGWSFNRLWNRLLLRRADFYCEKCSFILKRATPTHHTTPHHTNTPHQQIAIQFKFLRRHSKKLLGKTHRDRGIHIERAWSKNP